ncbi:MAG: winged helix-turn-helix domain-containing protein [Elusimicrobia bacterium]|nr:winged helix-turn-helix domain-containing protein [Candidatus Obscuribacterium magneticum]
MKTQTRSQILKIIEKNGKVRPSELRESLNISAQAIHRHLRSLTEQGIVEAKGSAPFTQYALAGVLDFEAVSSWVNAPTLTKSPESLVCETREILTARLPHLKSFVRNGLPESDLPLVIATAGEVGNNSFDHNLGQWRDVPGCWFESQVTGGHLWICIADRGQGIFQSLVKVLPHLADDQAALKAAFETIISGRAPEQRGNGLKFVKQTLSTTPGGGLACISGTGRVTYGEQGEKCVALLNKHFTEVEGTITLMIWRLK